MKKDKKIITSIIIIAIIIMIIALTIFGSFLSEDKNQRTDDFEEYEQLEFTIELVESPYDITHESPYDITNKSIYYQLKNISDKLFYYTNPEIGWNLDFFITAPNGTIYHYAGPVIYDWRYWKPLSPDEIENGTQMFGYKMDYSNYLKYNYTHWQNSTTEEYWFFQPGTYEIYGMYESLPHYSELAEDFIVGTWTSNVVTLTIK